MKRLRIGIVGAGFTGTALAATLQRASKEPLDITLCDKSGQFGAGPAYSTPFAHHLLNVRAHDMSAFEDEPEHFVNWLSSHPEKRMHCNAKLPLADQFVPRCYYFDYLQTLVRQLKVTFAAEEVVDVEAGEEISLIFKSGHSIKVDKVILALGNNPAVSFPFPVSSDIKRIDYPWDYSGVNAIAQHDPVLIVGMGLSMIDTVLTLLHQNHQGKIYSVSRHGLLPLPHSDDKSCYPLEEYINADSIRSVTKGLRRAAEAAKLAGGDWRSVINAIRKHVPAIWAKASLNEQRQFLRHLLPYWNSHRHRVHPMIMDQLTQLINDQQLVLIGGRVQEVKKGLGVIVERGAKRKIDVPVKWLINSMGPAQLMSPTQQPLLHAMFKRQQISLDPLSLGFAVGSHCAMQTPSGELSDKIYALGAATKGAFWEINAVPDLRRQILDLVRHLLG